MGYFIQFLYIFLPISLIDDKTKVSPIDDEKTWNERTFKVSSLTFCPVKQSFLYPLGVRLVEARNHLDLLAVVFFNCFNGIRLFDDSTCQEKKNREQCRKPGKTTRTIYFVDIK